MKKRDFPASYPLLGLLTFGPQSGYDLRKTAQATLGAFWHEGFAQVYESLEYFEATGLAEAVVAAPTPRRRTMYALTPQGREAFQAWLERPVEVYDFHRHELLVKVFFGRLLAPEILRGHLEAYARSQAAARRQLEALADQLRSTQASSPDLPYWLATVEHGACLRGALEGWTRQTLERTSASSESNCSG